MMPNLPIGDKLVGRPLDRVDGPVKVTGAVRYPTDVTLPGQVHAVLVQSTIGAGRIVEIDTAAAEAEPGVLTVITHANAPHVGDTPMTGLGAGPRFPLADDRIIHYGQHIAVVVAETPGQAQAAARAVTVRYEAVKPIFGLENPDAAVVHDGWHLEVRRGEPEGALSRADARVDETYAIAPETNNPLGLFATVAAWDGDRLVVHDCTQWPMMARQALAAQFGVPEENVRVLIPYLGGAFGAGLRNWGHTTLAALAARVVGLPVKLVLTRPQMFTSVGHRAASRQRVQLGADDTGRFAALDHDCVASLGVAEDNFSAILLGTANAYDWGSIATHDRQVRQNIPNPGFLRAPGNAECNFALESAVDEMAFRLQIDPLELRLRNFAETSFPDGLPWSSNTLRECYAVGAQRFGWQDRTAEPRSMRDGDWLVGYGMAGISFGWYGSTCTVSMTIDREGGAVVRCAATDIGTGTYTIAAQLAAELLGLPVDRVRVEIGDSDLPPAPQSGGSGLACTLAPAIQAAAGNLLNAFLEIAALDDRSPLKGCSAVTASDGRITLPGDVSVGESYTDILARHELDGLTAEGSVDLASAAARSRTAPAGAFAAKFVEVRVDEDLGLLRVSRVVTAVDGGRILNAKTARSQIIGGTVMGIGMAMFEDTVYDADTGRIANANFADYLVPVNADVPDLDVIFVGGPDAFNASGVKGIGEVGVVGIAAAIANAVHHATGRRIRSLPITIDQLL
jgi:CO/xanthine dehydrogenase Mo-binding subunit